ncbi:MAG: methyltransferase domain-containing protein [Acidobacteria bacterium]|nr:methyltransferase domain-containing protein [Acidobacteriota bacterium]
MKANLQRRVQRYGWDKACPDYESHWAAQLAPAHELLLAMADVARGETVLDVACGTGLVTFPAASAAGPRGRVTATDISEAMIVRAQDQAERRGLSNIIFQRADAESLPVPGDACDAAICALGLMYVPDPVQALCEMHRALRPGGRAVAAVWGRRERCGWAGIFPVVDARVESDVCPMFFQLGTGDALRQAFEQAGFVHILVERIETMLHYRNEQEALGAAFIGGPVALAHSRFDDATRAEAYLEYLDTIAPYRTGEGYAIPGEFVVARGWKTA